MYKVIAPEAFVKYFKVLDLQTQKKCKKVIPFLKDDPYNIKRIQNIAKLKDGKGKYRVRIGDYRLIYRIVRQKKEVILLSVEHRKNVYR